jgi:hypothetical protein
MVERAGDYPIMRGSCTARTLLLFFTIIAVLYAVLRAANAPGFVSVWLLCWVSALSFVTLMCRVGLACIVSAAISFFFGAFAIAPAMAAAMNPGATLVQAIVIASVIALCVFVPTGVGFSLALFGVRFLVNGQRRSAGKGDNTSAHEEKKG